MTNSASSLLRKSTLVVALGLTVSLAACNKQADSTPAASAPAPAAVSAPAPAAPSAVPVAAPVASAPVAAAPVAAPAPEPAAPKVAEHHHHAKPKPKYDEMASANDRGNGYTPPPSPPACQDCGTVVSVSTVQQEGSASGAGAVGGALAGGVLGHQMGKGRGKEAMTILGAIGGALAGNAAEREVRKTTEYDVVVQMDTGGTQTFKFTSPPGFGEGSKVRVQGGQLVPN